MNDCVFCAIVRGELPARVVLSEPEVLAFEDANPVAPVHVLVIPRRHSDSARDLDDDEHAGSLLRAAHRVAEIKGITESGYRLVINVGEEGGQTVYHTHVHVLGGRYMTWPPG